MKLMSDIKGRMLEMSSETKARHIQDRSDQGQRMRVILSPLRQLRHFDSGKRLRTSSSRQCPAKTRLEERNLL